MGRFEIEGLASDENLTALADLSGQWVDCVHDRRSLRSVVLGMDSSVSPTHGDHRLLRPLRLHLLPPLFVFNQFGDLERSALRAGNVHSAHDWKDVLEPVVARYRERDLRRGSPAAGSYTCSLRPPGTRRPRVGKGGIGAEVATT